MKKLLEDLFRQYHKDVYLYLFSLSRDEDLAEELTAETFLEIVRSVHGFRGDSDIKTWIFSIARRRWFAHLKRKKQNPEAVLWEELLTVESGQPGPEKRICDKALSERAEALLQQEPERTRNIVCMRLEGYSFYEIGTRFGISESSARVIDFRAKTKLKNQLKKEGYLDE